MVSKDDNLVPLTDRTIAENPELAKAYQDNASVGSENLSGATPVLKVHSVGKGQSVLESGDEPDDGAFFYAPTQEQFKEITCHILSISRGYSTAPMERGKKPVFTQLVAGVIEGEELKPFTMYMTSRKLPKLWEFGKVAKEYTKAKPFPIPMFALQVKLTTEKMMSDFTNEDGKTIKVKSWLVNFEILKKDDGTPVLVTDMGKFQYLKDMALGLSEVMGNIIVAAEKKLPPAAIEAGEEAHPEDDVPWGK